MANYCDQREQVCSRAPVYTLCKQAVRFHNIHNLLCPIPIEFMHIVVEQFLRSERRWRRLT